MSDFNINLLNNESHTPTDDFINNLGVFCFQPHILQPTRVTDYTVILIDNIFFNSIEHCCISRNLVCDISNHIFQIFSSLKSFLVPLIKLYIVVTSLSLMRKNSLRMFSQLNGRNEGFLACYWRCKSYFLNLFIQNVQTSLIIMFLSKTIMHTPAEPWITKGLRVSIAKKNSTAKIFKVKQHILFSKFKIYRNKLNHLLLQSKKMYYNNYFANNKYSMTETWRGIKQLITLSQSNHSIPTVIEEGGTKLTTSKAIAKLMLLMIISLV